MENGDQEAPRRISIEERAARRERIAQRGTDRYSSLIHALQAGREVLDEPQRPDRWQWHPIAAKLLLGAALVVALYALATVGLRLYRESQTETWSGPDAGVTSGQKLESCASILPADYDPIFPRWVRFEGRLYVLTQYIRPVGTNDRGAYQPTGYRLGEIQLYRITDTPDGLNGSTILLKLDRVEVGQLFREAPQCA